MNRATVAFSVLLGLLLASSVAAGPRCKAPKKPYQGKCLYPDEIARRKKAASPNPVTTPKPVVTPKPASTAKPTASPKPAATAPAPAPVPSVEPAAPVSTPTESPVATASTSVTAPARTGGDKSDETTTGWGWQRTTAFVLGGVAVVGAAVGGGLAASAASTYSDSEPLCPNNVCSDDGMSTRDDAFSKATGADVAFVVAGVALVGGIVLWLVAPSDKPDSEPTVAVGVGVRGAGPQLTAGLLW